MMNKILPGLMAALLLTGCVHRYDVVLVNGMRITHVSRPKLDKEKGVYTFTNIKGEKKSVNAGQVVEIGPH
jgi:hypothetical protein